MKTLAAVYFRFIPNIDERKEAELLETLKGILGTGPEPDDGEFYAGSLYYDSNTKDEEIVGFFRTNKPHLLGFAISLWHLGKPDLNLYHGPGEGSKKEEQDER